MAFPVKLAIGADHLPRDPGRCFSCALDRGAVSNYLLKRAVDSELKCGLTPGSGEPSGNVQVFKIEDAPFLRATPWQDVLIDWPWKNPAAVST